MATANTLTGASLSMRSLNHAQLAFNSTISSFGKRNVSFSLQQRSARLRVSCAAKQETIEKVCKIVRNQLALPDDSDLTGESKFAALGADSLDKVEILMGLEDVFGITVEENTAQNIMTVQEAADLIEDLVSKNVIA